MAPLPFDAVVMLTWSDWHTEMRSNRYHYASRFARRLPVIFVQPDQFRFRCRYEPTELAGVSLLHASRLYGPRQAAAIAAALAERGVARPLLWIYNHRYADLIRSLPAGLRVYHATEDYFYADVFPFINRRELEDVLQQCDWLVAVSEGVCRDYHTLGHYAGPSCVLGNGCDFEFWKGVADRRLAQQAASPEKVALFQGNLNARLDFALLRSVAGLLPEWTFAFCGPDNTRLDGSWGEWRSLQECKNVQYWGTFSPEELKPALCRATVGLIPFKPHPVITEASRPLKAFEYLACGLPVVSVPIATLQPYGDLFCFASTPQQFAAGVLAAGAVAFDEREVGRRVEAARREDYDARFGELLTMLEATVSAVPATTATPHADHTSPGADRPAVAKSGWTQMLPEPLLRGLDLVPGRVQRWAAAGRSRWLLRRRPRGT